MKKYFLAFTLLLFASVIVTRKHANSSGDAAEHGKDGSGAAVCSSDAPKPDSDAQNAKWYAPSGNLAYLVFGWPNGVTVWALFLTLLVIAEQTSETRAAANAAIRGLDITKTKERAKILLSPQPISPLPGEIAEANLVITNVGESSAFFGLGTAGLYIRDPLNVTEKGFGFHHLKVAYGHLRSGGVSEEMVRCPGNLASRYGPTITEVDKEMVHLKGTIQFKDAFEDWWSLEFHYVWRYFGVEVWFPDRGLIKGIWAQEGNNQERRISPPSAKQWWQFWQTTPDRQQPN